MSFIKKYYKVIISLIAILIVFILLFYLLTREVTYSVEYEYDGYSVIEKYEKKSNIYTFNISIDNYKYDFSINHKYTTKRKVIDAIESFDRDGYKCVSIKVYNNVSNTICNKDNDYYDNIITNNNEPEVKKVNGVNTIYNDSYDYLSWNGYGFTNLLTDEKHNFLTNESYSNNLSYKFGDYILVADYDQKREFNKFYIYNHKKNTVDTWNLKVNISHDSYFMGYIGDDIYLFDCSNKNQYRMNIKKKKIKISSKGNNAVYYDNGITETTVNKLYYNKVLFNYDKLYNYNIDNNHLYYRSHHSNLNIRVNDIDVLDIIDSINNDVFYLSSSKLYKFSPSYGEELLVDSFEWNFDYKNKIFVFSR